jgi:hypothetical protein
MSDASLAPLTQARRVEGAAGVLASLCGLIAFGVVSFAPRFPVPVSGRGRETISYQSVWERVFLFSGFSRLERLTGVGMLGLLLLCLLGLIAIGAGAYAHAVHQAVRGARWLWLGTAVLALVLTLIASVADVDLGPGSLVPLFVDPLLPALVLAALASGIAVTC